MNEAVPSTTAKPSAERGCEVGLIARNVAALAEAPAGRMRAIAPLSEEQARRLLEAVRGHRLEVLYRVALSLGLRRGKVLGLRWEDVDFANGTLRVSGALQRVNGKLVRSTPKTDASAATLPLPGVLVRMLRQQRQADERLAEDWLEQGMVFPSNRGTPMEPRNLVRHFKAALRRAGLPETTLSRPASLLRHTADRPRGAPARRDGDPAPREHRSDDEHLCARDPQQRDATAKLAELFAELPPMQQEEVVR